MSGKRLLYACLALCMLCATSTQSHADKLIWTLTAGAEPRLVFGLPESDAAQFVATCRSPETISINLATDVARLGNGEEVDIGFRGQRFTHMAAAKVIGVDAEQGITGVNFTISAADEFWHGLIKQDEVGFGIAGLAPTIMRFGEDREQIQAFLDQCNGAVEQAATAPAADNGASCTQFGTLKSKTSKQAVVVTFVNGTDQLRTLMWIDFKGQPQDFGTLEPGQQKKIKTFVTHPWMMTNGPGNCQEIYMPQAGDKRFELSAVVVNTEGE